jgi:hypothetical protein
LPSTSPMANAVIERNFWSRSAVQCIADLIRTQVHWPVRPTNGGFRHVRRSESITVPNLYPYAFEVVFSNTSTVAFDSTFYLARETGASTFQDLLIVALQKCNFQFTGLMELLCQNAG